jgi:16S rRNA (adenine1518-N6/adenine1519-N6)-dimethyltransferase
LHKLTLKIIEFQPVTFSEGFMSSPPPRKRFGQHFLHDSHIIAEIIAAIAPQPTQQLVEIGPGRGALTLPLLAHIKKLDVVELDRDLIAELARRAQSLGELRIYQADVLKFDFLQLVTDKKLRIVGNLPYNISTPLLFYLLNFVSHVEDMTFMLQKEVVLRMVAAPNTADYGRLSVMLQYHYEIEYLFDVMPEAFHPPPKVDSSMVQLRPHPQPPVDINDFDKFSHLVTQAFAQRRKTLRNTLKGLLTAEMMETLGISPQARAETLSLAEFAKLANAC